MGHLHVTDPLLIVVIMRLMSQHVVIIVAEIARSGRCYSLDLITLACVCHAMVVQHVLIDYHALTSVLRHTVDVKHRSVLIPREVKVVGALVSYLDL